MRDQQRSKFYAWSSGPLTDILKTTPPYRESMPLDICAAIVNWACDEYGVKYPEVKDGRRRRSACGSAGRICLPVWSRSTPVVLEEVAHSISLQIFRGRDIAFHGEEFLKIYIDLISKFHDQSITQIRKNAREAGLKIASSNRVVLPKQKDLKVLRALEKELKDVITLEKELRENRAKISAEIAQLRAKIRGAK